MMVVEDYPYGGLGLRSTIGVFASSCDEFKVFWGRLVYYRGIRGGLARLISVVVVTCQRNAIGPSLLGRYTICGVI